MFSDRWYNRYTVLKWELQVRGIIPKNYIIKIAQDSG